jgi:hypothetical protein
MPDFITDEAYSHEVSSCGFWPGGPEAEAMFYAYAYPAPEGYASAAVEPAAAATARRWASSCCRTRRCGRRRIRTPR